MRLEIVHSILLLSQGKDVQPDRYHDASFDTQAVSDIVKAMTKLV